MKERYTTRPHHHRLLGPTVEVVDNRFHTVASIYSGAYSEQRAEQRARELNAQDKAENSD